MNEINDILDPASVEYDPGAAMFAIPSEYWVQLEVKGIGNRTAAVQVDLHNVKSIRIQRENDEVVDMEFITMVGASAIVIGQFEPTQAREALKVWRNYLDLTGKRIHEQTMQKKASPILVAEAGL